MTQYEKLNFVNGSPPAVNSATLNYMEDGITAATEGVTAVEKTVKNNKAETDNALKDKPGFDDVYTVEEADEHFLSKYDAGNTYATKANLATKANTATTLEGYGITDGYTKTEVDEALSGKLDNTAGSVKTDNIANGAVTSDKLDDELKNNLYDIKSLFDNDNTNLLEGVEFKQGLLINHTNGEAVENGTSNVYIGESDFIEISNKIYILSNSDFENLSVFRAAYYDSDKNFISGLISATKIYGSSKAKYIRFTVDSRNFADGKVYLWTKEDYENHLKFGVTKLKTVTPEKFFKVEANAIADDTNYSPNNVLCMVNDRNLSYTLLDSGSYNLIDINKINLKTTLDDFGNINTTNAFTGVIESMLIKPGINYTLTIGGYDISKAWWLDFYGNPISALPISLSSDIITFTSPDNAYGIRCLVNYSNIQDYIYSKKIGVYEGDELLPWVAYNPQFKIKNEYLPGAKGNKDWSAYNYVAIGDSRTAGYNCNSKNDEGNWIWDEDVAANYPGFIGYYTGINVINKSFVGAAFCQRDGITLPTMYEQANSISSNTDIVTIFGMSNDRIIGVNHPNLNPKNERDNPENPYDVTTFKGAVRQTIKNIKLIAPRATIIFLTEEQGEAYDGGQTKKDMIEEVALGYKIPCLNLSLCAQTGTYGDDYLDEKYHSYTDGLHESIFGHRFMALAVAGEMGKYLW